MNQNHLPDKKLLSKADRKTYNNYIREYEQKKSVTRAVWGVIGFGSILFGGTLALAFPEHGEVIGLVSVFVLILSLVITKISK